ncbi:hypothetical protein SPRI_6075 [Streptomyces pristinaespiralis]|uniref:Uncharacterized protein n=1 Tax=Streptomyces pristinaespiralis TaxID=38300 RepID=A0A0M5IXE8_STRPR|nr:hypothetical protein SPRI_6075 [Streptomyces pristinaespiralis]
MPPRAAKASDLAGACGRGTQGQSPDPTARSDDAGRRGARGPGWSPVRYLRPGGAWRGVLGAGGARRGIPVQAERGAVPRSRRLPSPCPGSGGVRRGAPLRPRSGRVRCRVPAWAEHGAVPRSRRPTPCSGPRGVRCGVPVRAKRRTPVHAERRGCPGPAGDLGSGRCPAPYAGLGGAWRGTSVPAADTVLRSAWRPVRCPGPGEAPYSCPCGAPWVSWSGGVRRGTSVRAALRAVRRPGRSMARYLGPGGVRPEVPVHVERCALSGRTGRCSGPRGPGF